MKGGDISIEPTVSSIHEFRNIMFSVRIAVSNRVTFMGVGKAERPYDEDTTSLVTITTGFEVLD
jgi:hypothetical protein